jgi:hypothetical protein
MAGKRKGIWLGEGDLWLEEEAGRRGLKFSDFAKAAMREYVEGKDGTPEAIAELVVVKLAERGLVVRSVGSVVEDDASAILGEAVSQFL